jgi:hypothetical protein
MSTKSSISYGPNYHFYEEIFDHSNVYIQVEGYEYEVTNDKAMIQIPIEVWRKIIEDWSQKGWPKEQDHKQKEISSKWLESLEELVRIKDEDKTNES